MKKLLIVVDYQNDFVTGSLGFDKAIKIEKNIVNKIKEYQNNQEEIIFTLDTHYENYLNTKEGENLPIPHCLKGSQGHELYGEVKDLAQNYLKIEKETFGSKDLVKFLENKEYDTIELVGVVTNICVISNAVIVKTMLPNSEIIVDAACCSSNNEDLEKEAYNILKNLHIKVINENVKN